MTNREPKTASKETAGELSIDRDSFEPIYHQLANILRRQIATGIFLPGDRVPSETQLCEQYEVSPMTARRALMALLDDDLVTAARGRGTFVKPLVLGTATFGLGAFEELFNGERTVVRFLSVTTTVATPRISRKLAIPLDDKVIAIRRLLLRDGEPAAYHREFLIFDPLRPIVEAEMGITTLQGLFDGTGETMLKRGELGIQTTVLTEEEAELLNTPAGSAAFRIEHTFYDFDEQPVSWGWFIVPGNNLQFNATVGAQPVTT